MSAYFGAIMIDLRDITDEDLAEKDLLDYTWSFVLFLIDYS